jgi:ribosomal protein S30
MGGVVLVLQNCALGSLATAIRSKKQNVHAVLLSDLTKRVRLLPIPLVQNIKKYKVRVIYKNGGVMSRIHPTE